jgi:hypothetical protein
MFLSAFTGGLGVDLATFLLGRAAGSLLAPLGG